MKSCLLFLTLFCILAGCQPQTLRVKPPLQEQGELFVYAAPLSAEAERLRFVIDTVYAVKEDGAQYPLVPAFTEFRNDTLKRQRLFAAGQLPPGIYRGLSFRVKEATLRDEEGEQNLLLPKEAVLAEARFTVYGKKALLLSLSFDYGRSVQEGFGFSPGFTATLPGKPVTGLVGYVSNTGSNTLTVFDKQYKQVVGVIATGAGPRGMAFDQLRRRAYIALAGDDALEVVDIAAGEIVNRIRLRQGDAPQELALTPDGKLLLTANSGSNTVSVVDPQSFAETSRIRVGDAPSSILIDPGGVRAYVFNSLASSITVVDIASRGIVATLSAESGLSRGQFNRKGDILYTIHEFSAYLRLLNAYSLAVQQRYQVGIGTSALKVDTLTDLLYAGKRQDQEVEVYESTSLLPIATIGLNGGSATYMTIDGEENNLYVVNGPGRNVQVVNLVSREVVAEFDVGDDPCWVSLIGER